MRRQKKSPAAGGGRTRNCQGVVAFDGFEHKPTAREFQAAPYGSDCTPLQRYWGSLLVLWESPHFNRALDRACEISGAPCRRPSRRAAARPRRRGRGRVPHGMPRHLHDLGIAEGALNGAPHPPPPESDDVTVATVGKNSHAEYRVIASRPRERDRTLGAHRRGRRMRPTAKLPVRPGAIPDLIRSLIDLRNARLLRGGRAVGEARRKKRAGARLSSPADSSTLENCRSALV